jgi:hypothetical protein
VVLPALDEGDGKAGRRHDDGGSWSPRLFWSWEWGSCCGSCSVRKGCPTWKSAPAEALQTIDNSRFVITGGHAARGYDNIRARGGDLAEHCAQEQAQAGLQYVAAPGPAELVVVPQLAKLSTSKPPGGSGQRVC